MSKEKKPKVTLVGQNGNVFNLMSICTRALEKAGHPDEAKKMTTEIRSADSYDSALQIMMKYCDVN